MKYVSRSIKVFVFLVLCATGYYSFFRVPRIQLTVMNTSSDKKLLELTALIADQKKIIPEVNPNEKVLFRFDPPPEWHAVKEAADVNVSFKAEGAKTEVNILFPQIEEKKDYHFLISIKDNGEYEVSNAKE